MFTQCQPGLVLVLGQAAAADWLAVGDTPNEDVPRHTLIKQ